MIKKIVFTILFLITTSLYSQEGKVIKVNFPDGTVGTERTFKYPGGKDGLLNDIALKFKIPKKAIKDSISGQIILEITIDTLGVAKGRIIQGLRSDIDAAALDMVNRLKKSEPGVQQDKKVETKLRIPLKI